MAEFYDKIVITVPDGLDARTLAGIRREIQDGHVDLIDRIRTRLGLTDARVRMHLHDPVTGTSHDETVAEAKARRSGRG